MSGPSGDILTTFQAARLCGVSHKSIERWIDAGLLPGFRTPGGHRRVHRADLLGFVQSRRTVESTGRQANSTRGEVPRVLVVDDEGPIRAVFAEYYRSAHPDSYYIELAASGYEAG